MVVILQKRVLIKNNEMFKTLSQLLTESAQANLSANLALSQINASEMQQIQSDQLSREKQSNKEDSFFIISRNVKNKDEYCKMLLELVGHFFIFSIL